MLQEGRSQASVFPGICELSNLKFVNTKFLILRMLENRVLRIISGPKRDEVIGS